MAEAPVNIPVNIETGAAIAELKKLQSAISSFHSGMAAAGKAANNELANMQQNLINNINSLGGGNAFAARIAKVRSETEAFTRSLERNDFTMRQLFRNAAGSTNVFGRAFKSEFDTIQKVAESRVRTLQTQYINLGRDASGAMRAIAVRPLALNMDDLGTRTQIAAQKMQIFNESVKQGATQLLNWGKNTQWAGRQLMVGFTIPLSMMGAAAAKSFMELEKQTIAFKRVYGDLNTTTAQTEQAAKAVQDLAVNFTQYGVSLSDTMALAAKAAAMGKTGADLMAQVSETTRLSVLGQVDQQQALETTISLTNAFGTAADELAGKIDFLNAVENQTVTSIDDLTVAIPKAGPVIQQLGGNVEDLTFFLTAMREGGINASEGANALKSGLASIINPTQKAKDMLAGFGIDLQGIVDKDKGNVKQMVIDIASALDKLDPTNRAQAIEQLFGKFQFSRISTLFQNVIAEGSQAQKVLELTSATSQELAMLSERELKKVSESTTYKFEQALAKFQTALAPVGEQFLKIITPLIDLGTQILEQFNSWSDGAKNFATTLVTVIFGAMPVVVMMVGLFANFGSFIVNLIRKIVGFFALAKNGFKTVGGTINYMTQEELQAEAMAGSLDQAHAKLTQRFDIQNEHMQALMLTYDRFIQKQKDLMGMVNGTMPSQAIAGGRVGNFKDARKTPTTFSVSGGNFEQKRYSGMALMGPGNNAQGFGIDKEWLKTSQEAVASWRGAIIAGVNTSQTGQKFNQAATPLLDELLTTYRSGIDGAKNVADIGKSTYPQMKQQLADAVKQGTITLREAARINNSLRMLVAPTARQMTQYTSAPRYEGGIAEDGSSFLKRAGATERAGKSGKTANIRETNIQRASMGLPPLLTGRGGFQYAHMSDSVSMGTIYQEPRIRTQEGEIGKASAAIIKKTLESGGTLKQGQVIVNAGDAIINDATPGTTAPNLNTQAGKYNPAPGISDVPYGPMTKGQARKQKIVGGLKSFGSKFGSGAAGMLAYGVGSVASMIPGGEQVAQLANMVGTIGMVVQGLQMMGVTLTGIQAGFATFAAALGGLAIPLTLLVGIIGVVAYATWQANENMKQAGIEANNAALQFGASADSMHKLAEEQGKVLASDVVANERTTAISSITAGGQVDTQAGNTFLTTQTGKDLADQVKTQIDAGADQSKIGELIGQKLSLAVINGLMDAATARGAAAELGQTYGSAIGMSINQSLTDILNSKDGAISGLVQNQVANVGDSLAILKNDSTKTVATQSQTGGQSGTMNVSTYTDAERRAAGGAAIGQMANIRNAQNEGLAQLDLEWQKRKAILTQAGDMKKLTEEQNKYESDRNTLLDASTRQYQQQLLTIGGLTADQKQSALFAGTDTILKNTKGTAQEGAAQTSVDSILGMTNQTVAITATAALQSGSLGYETFNSLINVMGKDSPTISKILALDAKQGPGTTDMIAQLSPIIGTTGTDEITKYLTIASHVEGQDAMDSVMEVLDDPALNGDEKQAVIKYMSENADQVFGFISDWESKPPKDEKEALQLFAQNGYAQVAFDYNAWAALDDEQKKVFTTIFQEVMQQIRQQVGEGHMTADAADRQIRAAANTATQQAARYSSTSKTLPGPSGAQDRQGGGTGGGSGGGGSNSSQDSGTQEDPQLAKLNKQKDYADKQMAVVNLKEKAINKTYEDRKKALQEIFDIQKQIAEQQQKQLTLADALSKGDIAAAARATQDYRMSAAARAQDMQMKSLDKSQQNAIDNIMVNGKTKKQLEDELTALEMKIALRELELAKKDQTTKAYGGMIRGYSAGGFVARFKSMGTDTIPAMLTPGEFVVKKPAVDKIGINRLNNINSGNTGSESVYNYGITINAGYGTDADEIARVVMQQIKRSESYAIKGNKIK
jgi:TP901 family phage tail tape measure protein